MACALCFLTALLPLNLRYDISPINNPSLGVACLLWILNLLRGALLSLLGNKPGLQPHDIQHCLFTWDQHKTPSHTKSKETVAEPHH